MYGNFFPNLSSNISNKCVLTPNFVLGGIFLKKPEYPKMSRMYPCAVTKGGTILVSNKSNV